MTLREKIEEIVKSVTLFGTPFLGKRLTVTEATEALERLIMNREQVSETKLEDTEEKFVSTLNAEGQLRDENENLKKKLELAKNVLEKLYDTHFLPQEEFDDSDSPGHDIVADAIKNAKQVLKKLNDEENKHE